ncbi:ankyrin repeat-containing domain protein [Echria macrotheca]|uniref:Ankyrin repeat-containing domain protein n=1 Tax=Echria macrotheca TaxID=438768 RepID=A0AAJ0B269_9PEZI|nr:ankyrin repeat-containing domain protein [Echria macrotheca]
MAKDWAPVHEEIRRLYEEEGKPLHEVMRLVRGKFGFIASERSYRTQLKSWGYTKYSTESSPKPVKKRIKTTTTVLPPPAPRPHALPSMSQNDISGASNVAGPISLPDFSSFGGDGMLFNTTHDSSSSGALPSYSHFSIAHQLPDPQPFSHTSQRADGKTPLHSAVIENNYDSVKSLLFSGHGVEDKDASGNTPLHYAVLADSFETVRLLLQFGADVNAKCQMGRTPLHRAVTTSQESSATQSSHPLSFLQPLTQTRVLGLLINEGANFAAQDEKGDTPLHLAVGELNGAMDNDSLFPRTPPVIEALLKAKPDLNIRNTMGTTPFLKFVDMSTGNSFLRFRLISMFLKAGASAVMALPDGRTPLACFLHSYAKEWATMPRYGFKDREVRKACHTALRDLLDAGASIETHTSAGQPMLVDYFRTQYTRFDADLTLAENLCDLCSPNSTFEGGNTILHELAANRVAKAGKHCGTQGLIDIVVRKGANVNQQNDRGETPLMVIFTGKRGLKSDLSEQAMSALLRHGADPRVMDTRIRHIVLEAGNAFPKQFQNFLGPLFRAYISMTVQDGQNSPSSVPSGARAELKWLSSWESTVRKNCWGATKTALSRDFASDVTAVDTKVLVMAYTALAEHLVQGIVKQHDDGSLEREQARTWVSDILRTCRERNLPVEMKAYDSLLELC